MINDEQLPELGAYRALELNLPLWYAPKYGNLVVASRNDAHPVHRWFRFKEGYSADFLETVIANLDLPSGRELTLLDPFCGSGTTLLSATTLNQKGWQFEGIGIEVNPFIGFVAKTKINWGKIRVKSLLAEGEAALAASKQIVVPLPELTSISEGRCISRATARRLLSLREAINSNAKSANRNALLLGLAASIEPLSKIRKDGRALRIVNKARVDFEGTIRSKWQEIAIDVAAQPASMRVATTMKVQEGDGRNPQRSGIRPDSIDLIVTSPPYPNNIDYTEVYKLELWMMGFVTSSADFLTQRRLTLRSHPTCSLLPPNSEFLNALQQEPLARLLRPLIDRMDSTGEVVRKRLLLGYCADLYESLKNHFQVLRPGGYEILVVGNSLHGAGDSAFLLPSDLFLAAIGPLVGFQVQEVNIARNLKRRVSGNHFLRESVIVLRKPHAKTR